MFFIYLYIYIYIYIYIPSYPHYCIYVIIYIYTYIIHHHIPWPINNFSAACSISSKFLIALLNRWWLAIKLSNHQPIYPSTHQPINPSSSSSSSSSSSDVNCPFLRHKTRRNSSARAATRQSKNEGNDRFRDHSSGNLPCLNPCFMVVYRSSPGIHQFFSNWKCSGNIGASQR